MRWRSDSVSMEVKAWYEGGVSSGLEADAQAACV